MDARQQAAVRAAHEWFHHHSGWAPPDPDTLREWTSDGVCRCPDECLVLPRHCCRHGLASWDLIVEDLEQQDTLGMGAADETDP